MAADCNKPTIEKSNNIFKLCDYVANEMMFSYFTSFDKVLYDVKNMPAISPF